MNLGQRGHVVEIERQRQFGNQMVEIFLKFRLRFGQIIRRRDDERVRTGLAGAAGHVHGFDKRQCR